MTADTLAAIPWESLASWDTLAPNEGPGDPLAAPPARAPFAAERALNAKLSLWRGSLWRLRVDAVVNSTCETLRDSSGLCGKLLEAAGPQIEVECNAAGVCRTGEAVLTRGCQLPAKFLLHTVGPRYLAKYHNAAEHALHSCYRSVLYLAKEHALRSVAIGCIYTQRKGYPREEAAHIAARTVRRFLEHYGADFDRIVLCVDSLQDEAVYQSVLPLYFPRSAGEQIHSERMLARRDIGTSYCGGNDSNQQSHHGDCHRSGDQPERSSSLFVNGEESEAGQSDIKAFRAMLDDPDVERLGRLQKMQEERQRRALQAAAEDQKKLEKATASAAVWDYSTALMRAKQEDFADLKALGFCYCGGVDLAGLPVVVYLAGKLRVDHVDLERVLLFVLFTMDTQRAALSATIPQFSVLYVHSDVTDDNQPPTAWLKRLFRVFGAVSAQRQASEKPSLSHEITSALRFFYVLEPSMGLKFQLLLAKSYRDGSSFYSRVVYLSTPDMLDNIAPMLQLPPHIYTYVRHICTHDHRLHLLTSLGLCLWLGYGRRKQQINASSVAAPAPPAWPPSNQQQCGEQHGSSCPSEKRGAVL
ncbi:hypothetical protein BBJ28_00021307 [Nothophytophthora sp. Chile5]|nr:hypothetical protein BBJ28_00021307 [Nothophytophthora sp. Chile5]